MVRPLLSDENLGPRQRLYSEGPRKIIILDYKVSLLLLLKSDLKTGKFLTLSFLNYQKVTVYITKTPKKKKR